MAEKRKKGEGMIREYTPGKWMARITINGKQKAFYGKTEKEARHKDTLFFVCEENI
jgi:hypothetical protein